jgi:hypothetical protein
MRAVTTLRDKKTPVMKLFTAEVAEEIRRGRREKQRRFRHPEKAFDRKGRKEEPRRSQRNNGGERIALGGISRFDLP